MSLQTMPSDAELRPNRADDVQALEEDARLRNDIRLLGRILGDTVRDQEGADVFDLVERIRQTSIRFHRDEDRTARSELESILDSMSISETVRIVRAFSYFSHLANIAEDQNTIRQMRMRGGAKGAPRAGALADDGRDGPIQRDFERRPEGVLQDRAGQPRPDGAPDRSAPQEHHGPRDGGRASARSPRAAATHAGRI